MKSRETYKVMLINPPVTNQEIYGDYSGVAPCMPPLGLTYLAGVLRKAGFGKIRIIDGVGERLSLAVLARKIRFFSPDLVGITSTTASFFQATQVAVLVKKINPVIEVVLGGAHVTALPKETMSDYRAFDYAVIGEGEETLLSLVESLWEREKDLSRIRGLLWRKKGKLVVNKQCLGIKNLDKIPFPSRELLKDLKLYKHSPLRGRKYTTSMVTSRGCPFGCAFCDQSVFGHKWRAHSASYVVEEMKQLKNKYGVDSISFEDDNFLLSRERVVAICKQLIKEKVNLRWGCSARVNAVDRELLKLMKKAGCFSIFVGIESGSRRILKLMRKRISLNQIRTGVLRIKKAKINAYGSFILGVPGQTREEIEETISFACSLPLDGVSFFLYTPYPKTIFAKEAPKFGVVSHDWRDYTAHPRRLPFVPTGMTEREMIDYQRSAYIRFYLRPIFLLRHSYLLLEKRFWLNGFKIIKNYFWQNEG